MMIFEFIFYKMFQAYSKKKDMPVYSTMLYMFVLKFMIIILGMIILRRVLGDNNFFVKASLEYPIWVISILLTKTPLLFLIW